MITFKIFESGYQSWESMAKEVCEFASKLGDNRVISISHSQWNSNGSIIVWYYK